MQKSRCYFQDWLAGLASLCNSSLFGCNIVSCLTLMWSLLLRSPHTVDLLCLFWGWGFLENTLQLLWFGIIFRIMAPGVKNHKHPSDGDMILECIIQSVNVLSSQSVGFPLEIARKFMESRLGEPFLLIQEVNHSVLQTTRSFAHSVRLRSFLQLRAAPGGL